MDFLEKFENIFKNSKDPLINYQLQQFKNKLANDVRKIALTGNDIQDLVSKINTDLLRADII